MKSHLSFKIICTQETGMAVIVDRVAVTVARCGKTVLSLSRGSIYADSLARNLGSSH